MSGEDEEELFEFEQQVFHHENVWFYQIPRQASSSDPRAEYWNPDKPLLTGSLKVIQKGDNCWIHLYEPCTTSTSSSSIENQSPTLFASCPVRIDDTHHLSIFVQDCSDSSRYFVLRAEDEKTKRHAFVGIGFPERPTAFNFKASLQDYVRYRQRQLEAEKLSKLSLNDTTSESESNTPKQDLSLHEGQKIHIELKLPMGKHSTRKNRTGSTEKPMKLAPPPPPPTTTTQSTPENNSNTSTNTLNTSEMTTSAIESTENDDDWGDFESA